MSDAIFGHFGRILHVDLANRTREYREIDRDWLRFYLGGAGLGIRLLHAWASRGVDPLSEGNPIVFATGPLVGTALSTAAKFAAATKSPLTGFVTDSLASGDFALALKGLGVDALVVTGRARVLSVLFVNGEQVELREATALAGSSPRDAEERIRSATGGRPTSVAAIGLAGERLVRYATISSAGRHIGRGGAGAVMGSKNLKAIAIRGDSRPPVKSPERLAALAARLHRRALGSVSDKYRHAGTIANLSILNRFKALPTRNFQQATFDEIRMVSGEALVETRLVARRGCQDCPICCEHRFRSRNTGEQRLEYQALFALGPLCGIGDPDCLIDAAALCDHYGLDAVSTGGTIAWAMETAEKGMLRGDGGRSLRFGCGEALLSSIRTVAERSGIGDLLAEGSQRAAAAVGGNCCDWAMHVRGLEMPGWEPRRSPATALRLAVAARGGSHGGRTLLDPSPSGEGSAGSLAAAAEDEAAVTDSLIVCAFARGCFGDFYQETGEILSAATGWDVDSFEMRRAGERIHTLARLFNIREGWQPSDDTLPERLLTHPLVEGSNPGPGLTQCEVRALVQDYYRARRWDEQGFVPASTLGQAGLDATEAAALARAASEMV